MQSRSVALLSTALAVLAIGCGGSPSAPKTDEVFYLHGGGVIDKDRSWEVYFPKLDREKTVTLPRYVGVGVLDGDVRLSRPIDWTIRDADYTAERRFIQYQSPRQFTFSIYERVDPNREPWPDVLKRYEEETKGQGATLLANRQPIGTANSQGRAYLMRTTVKAKPKPYEAYSTEILVRSEERVLLVQIVHRGHIDPIGEEVAQAVSSMVVY
ncbi:MAG: hypothetical protein JNL21_33390 [Myxococcales bacterium]|jgi:hypothetical protein|nr:hypothetical protein [Myxococcales bacterium]